MTLVESLFSGEEDYLNLFQKYGEKSDELNMEMIEKYNIMEHKEFINTLRGMSFDIHEIGDIKSKLMYKQLEMDYNIIISEISDSKIVVFSGYYTKIDEVSIKNRITIIRGSIDIEFRKSTTYSIKKLNGLVEKDLFNYEFYFVSIVLDCIKKKGIDVHFTTIHENLKPVFTVTYRTDEGYIEVPKYRMSSEINRELIMKVIFRLTRGNEEDINNGGSVTSLEDLLGDGKYSLRLGTTKTNCGYSCTVRIQKRKTVNLKIDELGFIDEVTNDLNYLSMKTRGLTLVTGEKGSGKNTTIFSLVNEVLKRPVKIVEFSSPVELLMPIVQHDYNDNLEVLKGLTKLAKKQDVDLAIINEIADSSISPYIKDLVNSSIGVMTTTHIDRLSYVLYKLKEYFGESYRDIIPQINGVVTQKMFNRQCPHCRERVSVDSIQKEIKEFLVKHEDVISIPVSRGCSKCSNGFIVGGTRPLAESLIFTKEVKNKLMFEENLYLVEKYLNECVSSTNKCLDKQLAKEVANGNIHYLDVYKIL